MKMTSCPEGPSKDTPARIGWQSSLDHRPSDIAAALAATELFCQLPFSAAHDIADRVEPIYVPGETVLFRQGDIADGVYVVLSGRLLVVTETPDGQQLAVNEVRSGGYVGELALLTGAPRAATVIAARDSQVLRLQQSDFDAVLEAYPRAVIGLTRSIAAQLQRTCTPDVSPPVTLALIPVGAADARRFVDTLQTALAALGPTLCLSPDVVEQRFGPGIAAADGGGMLHRQLIAWLDTQEGMHRFVLFLHPAL